MSIRSEKNNNYFFEGKGDPSVFYKLICHPGEDRLITVVLTVQRATFPLRSEVPGDFDGQPLLHHFPCILIRKQRGLTTGMPKEDRLILFEESFADKIDHPRRGSAGVDGVKQ